MDSPSPSLSCTSRAQRPTSALRGTGLIHNLGPPVVMGFAPPYHHKHDKHRNDHHSMDSLLPSCHSGPRAGIWDLLPLWACPSITMDTHHHSSQISFYPTFNPKLSNPNIGTTQQLPKPALIPLVIPAPEPESGTSYRYGLAPLLLYQRKPPLNIFNSFSQKNPATQP